MESQICLVFYCFDWKDGLDERHRDELEKWLLTQSKPEDIVIQIALPSVIKNKRLKQRVNSLRRAWGLTRLGCSWRRRHILSGFFYLLSLSRLDELLSDGRLRSWRQCYHIMRDRRMRPRRRCDHLLCGRRFHSWIRCDLLLRGLRNSSSPSCGGKT